MWGKTNGRITNELGYNKKRIYKMWKRKDKHKISYKFENNLPKHIASIIS